LYSFIGHTRLIRARCLKYRLSQTLSRAKVGYKFFVMECKKAHGKTRELF
jgi:hypothetical protein